MELWVEKPFFLGHSDGRKTVSAKPPPPPPPARVPRVSRLMALALKLERQRRASTFKSLSEIARLGRVTQPYVTQIMNLLNLAPDIQEELLFLPPVERGRARIRLRDLQPVAHEKDWRVQRDLWRNAKAAAGRSDAAVKGKPCRHR